MADAELLSQPSAALGVPEAIVQRSAAARATANGVDVDEVLRAWAGGGAVAAGTPSEAASEGAEPAAAAEAETAAEETADGGQADGGGRGGARRGGSNTSGGSRGGSRCGGGGGRGGGAASGHSDSRGSQREPLEAHLRSGRVADSWPSRWLGAPRSRHARRPRSAGRPHRSRGRGSPDLSARGLPVVPHAGGQADRDRRRVGSGVERRVRCGFPGDTIGSVRYGPDLTHFGSREGVDLASVTAYLRNPRAARPESLMPPIDYLDDAELEALVPVPGGVEVRIVHRMQA